MAILTKAAILELSDPAKEKPLIEQMDESLLQGASYDLRLGDEAIEGGSFAKLDNDTQQYLEIPAHDVVVVSTKEKVNIPPDLVARFGLRFHFAMKGLVLNNEPQIDPGYSGRLFCLLYNLTDKPIILSLNQPFATIEFEKLVGPAEPYKGGNKGANHISDVLQEIIPRSGLKELSDSTKTMKEDLTKKVDRFYLSFFTVISIILTLLGLIIAKNLGVFGPSVTALSTSGFTHLMLRFLSAIL